MRPAIKFVLLLTLCFTTLSIRAQSLTGVWQGFITAEGNITNALVLHIKVDDKGIISGRSYLYDISYPELAKPLQYRGKIDFIGSVQSNTCKISELAILDSVMPNDYTFLCIKILNLKIQKEGNIDLLKGVWNGAIYSKAKCASGVILLKRYDQARPGTHPLPDFVSDKIKADNTSQITFLTTNLAVPVLLDVKTRVITLEVRDNLTYDYDTVSIYYNRNRLVNRLPLKLRPKKYTIEIDKLSSLNEIVMYANNLGRIPPNTSELTVDDGVKRQVVTISSNLQNSAVVYLRYNPENSP